MKLEGSEGIWMEREEWFVSGWEASVSRSRIRRTLSVFFFFLYSFCAGMIAQPISAGGTWHPPSR